MFICGMSDNLLNSGLSMLDLRLLDVGGGGAVSYQLVRILTSFRNKYCWYSIFKIESREVQCHSRCFHSFTTDLVKQ